jgi:dCMP deaminase
MKQVLLYLPVVHAGHEAFFARHGDAAGVLILGTGFRAQFKSLAKDIRALPPARAAEFLQVMLPGTQVRVIEPEDLPAALTADVLVLPDEDITRALAAEHHLDRGRDLVFDKTFLRWDREWSQAQRPADFDGKLAVGELPDYLVTRARELADHSSDWWRQVGAIAWRGEEVLGAAWNHHGPTEYAPYIDGDPRDSFSRGVRADLSTAAHAEASVIARAAREGIPLAGADLYVTTFPCPACARLIAESGFRRVYFTGPYSVLDGDKLLKAADVELLWVDAPAGLCPGAGAEAHADRDLGVEVGVADEDVGVDVGDRGAGEAAVAVADAEAVVIQIEPLPDQAQRGPEVAKHLVVQVKHVVRVLVRDDEQVQPRALVRKRVGRHHPVPCFERHPLAGVLTQRRRAEQADSRRLKPPHLGQLLIGPVVIRAVQHQPNSASLAPRSAAHARPAGLRLWCRHNSSDGTSARTWSQGDEGQR